MTAEREPASVLLEAEPRFGLEREPDSSLGCRDPVPGNQPPSVDRPELVFEDERSSQRVQDRARAARDAPGAAEAERKRVCRDTARALDGLPRAVEHTKEGGDSAEREPAVPDAGEVGPAVLISGRPWRSAAGR